MIYLCNRYVTPNGVKILRYSIAINIPPLTGLKTRVAGEIFIEKIKKINPRSG